MVFSSFRMSWILLQFFYVYHVVCLMNSITAIMILHFSSGFIVQVSVSRESIRSWHCKN